VRWPAKRYLHVPQFDAKLGVVCVTPARVCVECNALLVGQAPIVRAGWGRSPEHVGATRVGAQYLAGLGRWGSETRLARGIHLARHRRVGVRGAVLWRRRLLRHLSSAGRARHDDQNNGGFPDRSHGHQAAAQLYGSTLHFQAPNTRVRPWASRATPDSGPSRGPPRRNPPRCRPRTATSTSSAAWGTSRGGRCRSQ
jgi:hypothetical protein